MKKNETINFFLEVLDFDPNVEHRELTETSPFAEVLEVEQLLF